MCASAKYSEGCEKSIQSLYIFYTRKREKEKEISGL